MARPVALFAGQWADLPLEELAGKVAGRGFDGLELACWGDHFEVGRAVSEPDCCARKKDLLDRHGLSCFALGAHPVGQAVCDRIDSYRATFEDGDRADEVRDAIVRSSASGQRQELSYRSLGGGS